MCGVDIVQRVGVFALGCMAMNGRDDGRVYMKAVGWNRIET